MCLEEVEAELGDRLLVQWKSFLLRPYPEPKPLEKFRRYTQSWMKVAAAPNAARFRVWASDEAPPSHSIPPNVGVKAAARQGAFARYHRALMDAYFYDSRNVTDCATMVEVAESCGLDAAAFAAALEDPVLEHEVLADHREALELGIGAVPTVVVDGKLPLPGAQSKEVYVSIAEKVLAQKAGPPPDAAS